MITHDPYEEGALWTIWGVFIFNEPAKKLGYGYSLNSAFVEARRHIHTQRLKEACP